MKLPARIKTRCRSHARGLQARGHARARARTGHTTRTCTHARLGTRSSIDIALNKNTHTTRVQLRYLIYERYRSKDDYLGAHKQSQAFAAFRPKMKALQVCTHTLHRQADRQTDTRTYAHKHTRVCVQVHVAGENKFDIDDTDHFTQDGMMCTRSYTIVHTQSHCRISTG